MSFFQYAVLGIGIIIIFIGIIITFTLSHILQYLEKGDREDRNLPLKGV